MNGLVIDLKEGALALMFLMYLLGKYILDYSEKADKIFGKLRAKKRERRAEAVHDVLDPVVDKIEERDKNQMRIEMLLIYNTYKDVQEIPTEVFLTYCELFDAYAELKGNHYINDVIDPEVRSWRVV